MPILQHVSIPRPPGQGDIARNFYGQLLGLTEIPVPDSITHLDLTWFAVGENNLELHVFASRDPGDETGRHFCLVVDDLAPFREKLLANGYPVEDPEEIPGRPRFFTRDPFGNRVEFTSIVTDYLTFQIRSSS